MVVDVELLHYVHFIVIDSFNTLEHKVMYTKQIVHNGK